MKSFNVLIGGKLVEAESGKTFPVYNPATGEEITRVPLCDKSDVDKAAEAARKAFPVWSKKTQSERTNIMLEIAGTLKERIKEMAELETLDHGFPISASENVVQTSFRIFEYAAQCARTLMSEVIPLQNNFHVYMRREPIGVTALITPWNVPLNSVAKKVAYSIAVGNTCVVKPPSVDCLTSLKFAEILQTSGLPPGTVNIITGPGSTVGDYLVSHPGIKMISFTGSSESGKKIMSAVGGSIKRVQLELGGKNPFIVLEDADIDAAVGAGVPGVFFNSGQVCGAPGRFYVHEKIYEQFVEKFVAGMKKVVVGDPADRKTQMGPMACAEHRDTVGNYIHYGLKEGARLIWQGDKIASPPLNKGYFVAPAVFCDVKQDMKIAREEIFGPVAVILKFSCTEEVIEQANDSKYGLCASIWTRETAKGIRIAGEIQAGSVWVNSTPSPAAEVPWGGFKESGIGKEYSLIGFEDVTQKKVIGVNLS
ncbi:MAG TPA: aldehyde dehydrogenase family protein [Dehalococcoidales bacterium]|nr:aldehyde dehydrogenase family protein [Dehalococcoidales bacterium]